jgi:uncharacterized membrane protein
MESRYKLLGHPIQPMLIPWPLALLSTAAVFDVVGLVARSPAFHAASFWMILAGLVTGLGAALFGFLDYFQIPGGTRAKRIGTFHGLGNLIVVLLFAGSWLLRQPDYDNPDALAVVLAVVGAALIAVTGWPGGEMPYRLGIGIDDGANPNASSSLSGEPVRAKDRAAQP